MRKILLILIVFIPLFSSCDDDDYQKYENIKFDKNLVGSWAKIVNTKEYNHLFEINEDQKGIYFEMANDGNNNYYYKSTKGKYNLTKGEIFIFTADGEKHSKNWGVLKSVDPETLILIREKSGKEYEEKFYSLDYLEKEGYKKSDVPNLFY